MFRCHPPVRPRSAGLVSSRRCAKERRRGRRAEANVAAPPGRRSRWRGIAWAGVLLGCLAGLGANVPRADANEALVDAVFQSHTDSQGFNWDVGNTGMIGDGSNDCFDGGMILRLDNWNFQVTEPPKMTKDGRTFVLVGRTGDIEVTRRVTVDAQAAAVRSVETVRNRGAQRVQVQLSIGSQLGGNCQSTGTNERAQAVGPALDRKEHTVYAFQPPGGRPSVFWCVRAPRNRGAPSYSVSNQRYFNFTWPLDLMPGRTISVLTTVGQRRWTGVPGNKALEQELKPFLQARWAQGLPPDVAASLLNFHAVAEATLDGPEPVLGELLALAQGLDVQRDGRAHLAFPDTMPLSGSVSGTALRVRTRHGERDVPVAEIAALRGGAGRGRTPRVYLRSGEILVGAVQGAGLALRTESGLQLPLAPDTLDTLFLPKEDGEGEPDPGTNAFVTLLDGTRLALREARSAALDATTPWGRLRVPGGEVVRLLHAPEPVPGMWVALADGSRFPFLAGSDTLELESLAFGPIRLPTSHVAAWSVTKDPRPPLPRIEIPAAPAVAAPAPAHGEQEQPSAEGAGPPAPGPAAAGGEAAAPEATAPPAPQYILGPRPPPNVPYVRLRGDTLITATLQPDQLPLVTAAGPVELERARIVALRRVEDELLFDVLLVGGGPPLRARLGTPTLGLQTAWGPLQVPQAHLELIAVDPKALAELDAEAARLAALAASQEKPAEALVEETEEIFEEEVLPMPPPPPRSGP